MGSFVHCTCVRLQEVRKKDMVIGPAVLIPGRHNYTPGLTHLNSKMKVHTVIYCNCVCMCSCVERGGGGGGGECM